MELTTIKGIGPKSEKLLNKLNIYNTNDLVNYYPYRYEIIKRSNMDSLKHNDKIIIDGIVESVPVLNHFKKRMNRMQFRINTTNLILGVTIFNRAFLKNKIIPGMDITVIGKYDKLHNQIIASDIRFIKLPDTEIIESIYHTTPGINSNSLNNYIAEALDITFSIIDFIPDYLIDKYNFLDKYTSLKQLHHPTDLNKIKNIINRFKYEELFLYMLKINELKRTNNLEKGLNRNVDLKKIKELIETLPFKLTSDQLKVIMEIYDDMNSNRRMNRLVQGDVGSGKTIVSFIAIYINYLAGYQSALMVPTEILANQHYKNIIKMFNEYNIKIELLTGKLKAKEKKEISKRLEEGKIDVVVGTHALISSAVEYKNLGLVITDEQHRFGVNQRATLKNKGIKPDVLYMSATPIPRTYALTLYGDMDVSSITTMPIGRKEIITKIKTSKEIRDVLEDMLKQLKQGYQIYVIAPMIEESEEINSTNVATLTENMERAFGKYYKIGSIHGKMDNATKEKTMMDFKDNMIQILISTTVIEVGVDVPNATMIVIFDSDRFGLSTIHQLRGRVGRNNRQSYCYLICDKDIERIKILEQTSDGFKISEEDFRLRGSGDLFGYRQSGEIGFKLSDLKNDYNILLKAKEDSEEFLAKNDEKYVYIKDNIKKILHID